MLADIDAKERTALDALAALSDAGALDAWKSTWIGPQGALRDFMSGLKNVSKELKPAVGARVNQCKSTLEAAYEARRSSLGGSVKGPQIDVTEPGVELPQGCRHVIARTIEEIVDVFSRMGFAIADGPELEDEWHNFNALNIPAGHPARGPADNFYLGGAAAGKLLLRTQTSTVQIRAMESQKPPLKVIAIGRVYRPDTHDATHYSMFHQVEGLCIDRGVSMVDLKTTLVQFAKSFFGAEAEVRMRPSFFPFTEPSAELDMKMKIKGEWKWVELGGCGMVDPNVLTAVGIDPEEWTGFAFGLGIERVAMRRYGITDIRLLFENDARFLRQFA
ncbi:MAG: phenylalanine--tRNA ligase subunit alpha [Phycisphaerales bacterium]|nr:phenylalanine--tRNA ligase subunit alpha [Phycisphaerales bacterium]